MKKSMIKKLLIFILFAYAGTAYSAGISIDAGLTPARDRFILRTQWRYMHRSNDAGAMDMNALVTVVAYGLRRDVTLVLKQPWLMKSMSGMNMAVQAKGLADLGVLVKYKLYRKNTATHIIGLATTVGVKVPSGTAAFSTGLWDVKPGLYGSLRRGLWATDLAAAYSFTGVNGPSTAGLAPGNEMNIDWAISIQFPTGRTSQASLAPVLEMSFVQVFNNKLNGVTAESGESILYVSPGIKYTVSSFIVEALYRHVLVQKQNGMTLRQGPFALVGLRFMF